MIGIYRSLYAPFPIAVLMGGLTLGLASNLMTDVFRTNPFDYTRLAAACLHFVSAVAFSMLHGEFVRIDENARALISSGGGIPKGEALLSDMLGAGRRRLLLTLSLAMLAFLAGVGVSSGLFRLSSVGNTAMSSPTLSPAVIDGQMLERNAAVHRPPMAHVEQDSSEAPKRRGSGGSIERKP